MADSGGPRTGRFIIRARPAWQRRLWLVVGIVAGLLLLYGAYEAGRFQGGYSKFAELMPDRGGHIPTIFYSLLPRSSCRKAKNWR